MGYSRIEEDIEETEDLCDRCIAQGTTHCCNCGELPFEKFSPVTFKTVENEINPE